MAYIFLDFETRSRVDLRKSQAAKYAADPSTIPLMLAYGSGQTFRQWRLPPDYDPAQPPPGCPDDLRAFAEDPRVEFHAHNAAFEIAIWEGVCVQRWGWPAVPLCRWHCTAAQAALANQPRALEAVGARLRLSKNLLKDGTGKGLIKALSVPVRAQATKNRGGVINTLSLEYQQSLGTELFEGQWGGKTALYFFNNDPQLLDAFARYNLQDIVAEAAVHERLPAMPESEHAVWVLDREINRRGIPIDVELCQAAVDIQKVAALQCNDSIHFLTGFDVEAGTQRQRLVTWLNERVNFGESLTEDFVNEWVESFTAPATWGSVVHPGHDPSMVMPEVLKVLELRTMTAGTAVAKFQAALDAVSEDGRVRDQLLYCGATTTGRWAGRGIQPHNMKRSKTPSEDVLNIIKRRDWPAVLALAEKAGQSPLALIKGCIRGMVLAPPGRQLIVSDFAGIESRVLNWLCGNDVKLDLFRASQDTYIKAALDVYGGTEADIADWDGKKWKIKKEHAEKRQVGKVCELALGYGMGAGKFVDTARKMAGVALTPEFAEQVVTTWREKNERIRAFWYRLEKAVVHQVRTMTKSNRRPVDLDGKLLVGCYPGGYVTIRLPSGRKLFYFQPKIDENDGRLLYLDGSKNGKPELGGRIDTYGGKLVENVVQAISRDLLVHSMQIIDAMGLDIILHVHDEGVVEADADDPTVVPIVHQAMETLPPWAAGLPLAAETQAMRRYSK